MPKLCSKVAYYAGSMLNALSYPLCLKLRWHNRHRPLTYVANDSGDIGTEIDFDAYKDVTNAFAQLFTIFQRTIKVSTILI